MGCGLKRLIILKVVNEIDIDTYVHNKKEKRGRGYIFKNEGFLLKMTCIFDEVFYSYFYKNLQCLFYTSITFGVIHESDFNPSLSVTK